MRSSSIPAVVLASAGLTCALLPAPGARAALKKYDVVGFALVFSVSSTPTTDIITPEKDAEDIGTTLIEDGAPPVLRLFRDLTAAEVTVDVPGLSGFVWVSRKYTEGPESAHSGISGSTADRIVWGTVTGWSITGQNWCNAEPATICLLAGDADEQTTDSRVASTFYDIGTWYFHGTGFTTRPYVYSRFTTGAPGGNQQVIYRGRAAPDGTVPMLPLAGVALLGAGVALAGLAGLHRRAADPRPDPEHAERARG